MPIPYTPLILVIKDIENNISSYNNGEDQKNKNIMEKNKNYKKETIKLKKIFSFDDFFKIHLY